MRITFSCPFDCADEEHETEVEPEICFGSLGWDGGVSMDEPLPCGGILSKQQFDDLQMVIHDKIVEHAHPDP